MNVTLRMLFWGVLVAPLALLVGCGSAEVVYTPVRVDTAPVPAERWITTVAVGRAHTCAITRSGALWCWGRNDRGQSGQSGATTDVLTPARVVLGPEDRRAVDVSSGRDHTCAVDDQGEVWCWGQGGELGVLGLAARDSARPVQVLVEPELRFVGAEPSWVGTPLGEIQRVTAGACYTCALRVDGGVVCWGDHEGEWVDNARVREVPGLDGVVWLAAGLARACALTSDGRALCNVNRTPLALAAVPAGARAIAASEEPCVVAEGGRVFCWSDAGRAPEAAALDAVVVSLDGWWQQLCVVADSGAVSCGRVLGADIVALSEVLGPYDVRAVRASSSGPSGHACAVMDGGRAACWGRNDHGQLGDGSRLASEASVEIALPAAPSAP